jgi:hypothetical protein
MSRIALALSLLLYGCASDRPYIEPKGSDVSRVAGKLVRETRADWERYALREIDGLEIPRSLWEDAGDVTVAVAPGLHHVLVRFEYSRTRRPLLFRGPGEPRHAYYVLQARFEAGREYQVNGDVGGQFTEVWLEDKVTGQAASARVRCEPGPKTMTAPVCRKPAGETGSRRQD